MKKKALFFLVIAVLTVVIMAVFIYTNPVSDFDSIQQSDRIVQKGSVSVNSPAPVFYLPDLMNNIVKLDDYRGKIVILNFWATWCNPCKEEMPLLDTISQEHEDEIVIIGVAVEDSVTSVRRFLEERDISYPILLDETGVVSIAYHVIGYPTTYFIDAAGIIRGKYVGMMSFRVLQQNLLPLGINL